MARSAQGRVPGQNMRTEFEKDRIIFHFRAPATIQITDDALTIPEPMSQKEVVFDFQDVRIISSMVIAGILMFLQKHPDRKVQFLNVGSELHSLILRIGMQHWEDYMI